LKETKPTSFGDFERNMEKHIYSETKRVCGEARTEKQRLLSKAKYYNHKPEIKENLLRQADNLKSMGKCDLEALYYSMLFN